MLPMSKHVTADSSTDNDYGKLAKPELWNVKNVVENDGMAELSA